MPLTRDDASAAKVLSVVSLGVAVLSLGLAGYVATRPPVNRTIYTGGAVHPELEGKRQVHVDAMSGHFDTITANRLVIEDADGKMRAFLGMDFERADGEPGFILLRKNNKMPALSVLIDETGSALLIQDATGNASAQVRADGPESPLFEALVGDGRVVGRVPRGD